jgi:hypothetical protein
MLLRIFLVGAQLLQRLSTISLSSKEISGGPHVMPGSANTLRCVYNVVPVPGSFS